MRLLDERPATGRAAAGEEAGYRIAGTAAAGARTALVRRAAKELSQSLKAVGRHKPPGDEFAQAPLDVRTQAPGAVDDLVEEESAPMAEQVEDFGRRAGLWPSRSRLAAANGAQQ